MRAHLRETLWLPRCLCGGIVQKTIYHRGTEIAQRTTEPVSTKLNVFSKALNGGF